MADDFRKPKSDILIVAALELGCKKYGMEFSFRNTPHEFHQSYVISKSSYSKEQRIPMSLLFTEDMQLDSIGYVAEDKYADLKMDHDHQGWFFFRHLDTEPVGPTLNDVNGKKVSTMKIYSSMIRLMYDSLMEQLKSRCGSFDSSDLHFVITLPEYWTYRSNFISDAAQEAGIARNHFGIMSRSHAQLAYCRTIPGEGRLAQEARHIIIIDLEESTAEVHVFEKQGSGSFTIVARDIRDTRSVSYNKRIHQWLKDSLGCNVYDKICNEYPDDIIRFERDLEMKLLSRVGSKYVRIPMSFKTVYEQMTGSKMKADMGGGVQVLPSDKLTIQNKFFKAISKPYIDCTSSMVLQVASDIDVQGHSTVVFIVGRVSRHNLVEEATREILTQCIRGVSMITVEEPELAAIRGGLIAAYAVPQPPIRVSRYTYGVETGRLLKAIVKRGQDVSFGAVTTSITIPTKIGQTHIVLTVIATTRDRPLFRDSASDRHVGTITINVPSSSTSCKIDIEVSMEVAVAELIVTAKELISKRRYVRKYAY